MISFAIRRAVGPERLGLHSRFRLELPADSWIDLEAAREGVHRAESAVAAEEWARVWGPSQVALYIARREFLAGESAPWIDEWRRHLREIEICALECFAAASIGVGVSELASAERSARKLIEKEPYRESGYRLLMEALARRGNGAEAMQVYDDLRRLLREELGVSPARRPRNYTNDFFARRPRPTERRPAPARREPRGSHPTRRAQLPAGR